MEAIEKCSQTSNVWKGAFRDEMKRKSALRRLCKYRLPSSTDIDMAIRRDDDMYDLDQQQEKPKEEEDVPKKSKLEDVVTSQNPEVEEAEFKPEPEPKNTPTGTEVQGIVDDIKAKSGETNGKKWSKFGARISGNYYGTFDKKINDMFVESMDNKTPVKIKYDSVEKNGKTFYNVLSCELVKTNSSDASFDDDIPI